MRERRPDHALRLEGHALSEPQLVFNGQHRHIDPKAGLEIYGPYSLGEDSAPLLRQIDVGIIAPGGLIPSIKGWLEDCRHVVTDATDPFAHPAFPGLSDETAFQCRLNTSESWERVLPQRQIAQAITEANETQRIASITRAFTDQLQSLAESEPQPKVVVIGLTEDIIEACGAPVRRQRTPRGELTHRRRGQLRLGLAIDGDEPEEWTPTNLRTALKGAAMPIGLATQILRESTIRPEDFPRRTQDRATLAWNFVTALYYKAGGHPWRLADAQRGTCYVGIDFFVDRFSGGMRAALAQVFSERGEGLVLRGRSFEWQGPGRNPHLSRFAARDLLDGALSLYERHGGLRPQRLVVHKSSVFTDDEIAGVRDVAGDVNALHLLVISRSDSQAYRSGIYPPLRGTAIRFADDQWLLYTKGYVPFLRTYPGMRVPRALEITGLAGDSSPDAQLREVLALSKMNWNNADFAVEFPITLAFADRVGAILGGLSPEALVRPEYRFYM